MNFKPVYPTQVKVHEIALDVECLCGRNNYIETTPLIMFTCDCGRKYRIGLTVEVEDDETFEFSHQCGACVSGAMHTADTHRAMIAQTLAGEPC